jgi:hypothetical protein
MKNIRKTFLFFCILIGILCGAVVACLNPGEKPWIGFFSAALLTFASLYILGWLWRKLGGNRVLAWTVLLTFLLRLGIGMLLFITLPVFGYDEDPTNAGYLYLDAYRRDGDAWQLAESGEPLGLAFQEEFTTDQYGGLLSFSALMYRVFSPDGHRPLLILILTSFASALGLPFFWQMLKKRWGEKTANTAAWLYALYPESVILGASQMREPLLIGLTAIAAWGISKWKEDKAQSLIALGLSFLFMMFFSFKAAGAILAGMAIWFWLENTSSKANKNWRVAGYILLAVGILVGVYFSWSWLVDSSKWDLYLMESSSGRIQWEVELIGEKYRAPFIIGYGIAQPVLPAAIIYPGIPINQAIAIFRSLGWYLLAPLLITCLLLLWKDQSKENRHLLLYFLIVTVIWTLISSARAGGDQWDNPRYRSIFMIWMIVPAAWTWVTTLEKRSPWLWRLLALELFYIGFFIQWYLSRYYGLFKRMDFWPMVRLLGSVGLIIIPGGFVFDWIHKKVKEKRLQ